MVIITGTLRKTRKGIPKEMTKKFGVGEKKYMRSDELLMVGFRKKKIPKKPCTTTFYQ